MNAVLRTLTLALLLLTVMPIRAQEQDAQQRAAALGKVVGQGALSRAPTLQFDDGGDRNQGVVTVQGKALDVNDIVPGGSPGETMRLRALEKADDETLRAAANAKRAQLERDPSAAAGAVRDIGKTRKDDPMALARDEALWAETKRVLTGQHPLSEDLGGCESRLEVIAGTASSLPIWHEKTCEVIAPLDRCARQREIEIERPLRTIADQYHQVNATTTVDVRFDQALEEGEQILAATALLDWSGSVSNVEITTPATAANQWVATVTITATAASSVSFQLSAQLELLKESFTFPDGAECLMASDGFCSAQWTCNDDAPRTIGGRAIDATLAPLLSALYPSGTANLPNSSESPNVCWQAEARYDCPLNIGAMDCWTNPNGAQVCHENTQQNTASNTCAALENNSSCQLLRSQCAQDATGHSEHCYVMTHTFRCSEMVDSQPLVARTRSSCETTIRCAGEDCFNTLDKTEPVQGIGRAMAAMNLVQHLGADRRPTPARTAGKALTSTQDTTIFNGRPYECRKALGSAIDCCSDTLETGSDQKWIDAYRKQQRQTHAANTLERNADQEAVGSWKELSDGIATMETLEKNVTSRRENVTGGADDYTVTDPIAQQGDTLQVLNEQLIADAKDEHMLDSGYMCSANEWELAQQKETGNCASIGSYCRRSVFGACIEKREVYCCFNSPLTRMAREQIAGQAGILAGAFGTPKAPRCDGIQFEQLADGSLKKVVLTEWEARLTKAGVVPKIGDLQEATSLDRLTGRSSLLGQEDRKNLRDRTQDRVAGIDGAGTNRSLAQSAQVNLDRDMQLQRVPGDIGIEGAVVSVNAGQAVRLRVRRRGDLGAVVVGFATADGTAQAGLHYDSAAGALSWRDGESGTKTITIPTHRFNTGPTYTLRLVLSAPSGGARLYPNDTAEISIRPLPFRNH